MPYKFIEEVTIADTAIEATGKTLTELFKSSAEAIITSLANPKTIKPAKEKKIKIKADTIDRLLFEFLEELIYLKDKNSIVFNSIEVKVNEKEKIAEAIIKYDKIKKEKQELKQDIKAITMHYFLVQQTKDGWKANFVVDI